MSPLEKTFALYFTNLFILLRFNKGLYHSMFYE